MDRSNALAQARAADNTLVDLIDQGQAAIASNQAAIMAQLAVIIGKQVWTKRTQRKKSVEASLAVHSCLSTPCT